MLNRLLTFLAFTRLGSATIVNGYHQACKAVEAAISNTPNVYYPGEYDHGQPSGSGEAGAHG